MLGAQSSIGIHVDTIRLEAGRTEYQLFETSNGRSGSSIGSLSEDQALRLLLGRKEFLEILCDALAPGAPAIITGWVPRRELVYSAPNGDLDLLLCENSSAEYAHAVEVKRIKVTGADWKVNGTGKVGTLFAQATERATLGFHQTWALVLIVQDLQDHTFANTVITPLPAETIGFLNEKLFGPGLSAQVGIAILELVQPTGKSFHEMCTARVAVVRRPERRQQPRHLTASIEALLQRRNATMARHKTDPFTR